MLDIETDGSIHPENALKSAANILIQHFMLFSDQSMILDTAAKGEPEQVDEELLHMRKLLKTSLNDLDLSVRAYNCLKAAEIRSLGDLVNLEIEIESYIVLCNKHYLCGPLLVIYSLAIVKLKIGSCARKASTK